jgi:perosamine synthetase
MLVSNDTTIAEKARRFRHHGIDQNHHERAKGRLWHYDMTHLGYNYRITDLQCALGTSQLKKLPAWLTRRREIAAEYGNRLRNLEHVTPLHVRENVDHAYHLFVIRIRFKGLNTSREELFETMHSAGIGINVHCIPVHIHSYYRETYGYQPQSLPHAEQAYEEIVSLPMFPMMTSSDIARVCETLKHAIES